MLGQEQPNVSKSGVTKHSVSPPAHTPVPPPVASNAASLGDYVLAVFCGTSELEWVLQCTQSVQQTTIELTYAKQRAAAETTEAKTTEASSLEPEDFTRLRLAHKPGP